MIANAKFDTFTFCISVLPLSVMAVLAGVPLLIVVAVNVVSYGIVRLFHYFRH